MISTFLIAKVKGEEGGRIIMNKLHRFLRYGIQILLIFEIIMINIIFIIHDHFADDDPRDGDHHKHDNQGDYDLKIQIILRQRSAPSSVPPPDPPTLKVPLLRSSIMLLIMLLIILRSKCH